MVALVVMSRFDTNVRCTSSPVWLNPALKRPLPEPKERSLPMEQLPFRLLKCDPTAANDKQWSWHSYSELEGINIIGMGMGTGGDRVSPL